MKKTTSKWLQERANILAKYAQGLPHALDRIKLRFDYPEFGWIDVHVLKNDEEVGIMEFSDVYDTFVDLMEWLEAIAKNDNIACAVNMNCEDCHEVFGYEPVWFFDGKPDNSWGRHPRECGIFIWYQGWKEAFPLDAYCNTRQFIRDIYTCIMDFSKKMKDEPKFLDDWDCSNYLLEGMEYDEEDPRMKYLFYNRMKSEIIEDYLDIS